MNEIEKTESLIFDMDNTLYDYDQRLLERLDVEIVKFIEDRLNLSYKEANELRIHMWHTYGTTMNGVFQEYNIIPSDFMRIYDNIDISHVKKIAPVIKALTLIKQKKFVFTNSPRNFADRILKQLGIENCFDGIFCAEDAEFISKPDPEAYYRFLKAFDINPKTSCMFEDTIENLETANNLGMQTVWIYGENSQKENSFPFINLRAERISHILPKFYD